jgi:hypothetical protein
MEVTTTIQSRAGRVSLSVLHPLSSVLRKREVNAGSAARDSAGHESVAGGNENTCDCTALV